MTQLKRLGRIVGVYVLFGPPLGAVVTIVILLTQGAAQQIFENGSRWLKLFPTSGFWTGLLDSLFYGFAALWFMMGLAVFGYVLGLLPALLAGLIVALRQIFFDRGSWRGAAAVGALVGIPYSFVLGWPFVLIPLSIVSIGQSMVVCALTSALCWLLVDQFSSSYWRPTHDHHA
jgi:hypothetical protein